MNRKDLDNRALCNCGSKNFETVSAARNKIGRMEYFLRCRACGTVQPATKSVYALYKYVRTGQPSRSFLKLFDLDHEQCQ